MAQPPPNLSYPLLKRAEIRETLSLLEITVTDDDLANPSAWMVRQIFEKLIERILNLSREEYAQISFHAADYLEFQELHEDAVQMMAFFKACQKLLAMCGAVLPGTSGADFTLQDLGKPEGKRLCRHLSAVINFALFIDSKEPAYVAMAERTELLRQQKTSLEQECTTIDQERRQKEQQRNAEKPAAEELEKENDIKVERVRELWTKQTNLHTEKQTVKKALLEAQDATREAQWHLQTDEEERDGLKAQVVPDPRKLKCDLAALQSGARSAREEVRALELTLAQHAQQREALSRVEQQLLDAVALQSECEVEKAKVQATQKQTREAAEKTTRTESSCTQKQREIKTFNSRIEREKATLERTREQHREKIAAHQQTHADAERRWSALVAERSVSSRQRDENESQLREFKEKLHRGRIEHEEEVADVRQQQHQLAIQVRAYHQDLLKVMKDVSASRQPLAIS